MSKDFYVGFLIVVAVMGRMMAIGYYSAVNTVEKSNEMLRERIYKLSDVDRDKCIDLLIKNEI